MGGIVSAVNSIFSGPDLPEPEPVPSPEQAVAERNAAAEEEERRQQVAAVQATSRRKLNSPLTGAVGVVENDDPDITKGGLF